MSGLVVDKLRTKARALRMESSEAGSTTLALMKQYAANALEGMALDIEIKAVNEAAKEPK